MWNLKNGQTELLCRTDTHRLCKNLWFPKGTVWGGRGMCWGCDGNPIKLDCDDYTTINVINSLSNKK